MEKSLLILGASFFGSLAAVSADVFYVDILAQGIADGSEWKDAFPDLQLALAEAKDGDSVFVAQGNYTPTATTDRSLSFVVPAGVQLYGGFDTGGSDSNARDAASFPTILSGEIGSLSQNTDNSFNVVTLNGGSDTTLLDGFTITRGSSRTLVNEGSAPNGDPIYSDTVSAHGGGLTAVGDGTQNPGSDAVVRNCRFIENVGAFGGAFFGNNVRLEQCYFAENEGFRGGAVYGSYLVMEDCEVRGNATFTRSFLDNNAQGEAFQGLESGDVSGVSSQHLSAINCLFAGNRSGGLIGAIEARRAGGDDAYLALTNCAVVNNAGGSRPGVAFETNAQSDGELYLSSTVIWGNGGSEQLSIEDNFDQHSFIPTVQDSVVENQFYYEGTTETTNTESVQPRFRNPIAAIFGNLPTTAGDYRPLPDSGLVNRGSDASFAPTVVNDLDGEGRTSGPIDIGPYELDIKYVDADATGASNGSSWANAYPQLELALGSANENSVVWLAEGTYKPTTTTNRNASFIINEGVQIYGGFDALSDHFTDRVAHENVVILSGDIGVTDDQSDNSFHVVNSSNSDETSLLDGLTISLGQADGTGVDQDKGGGLFSNGLENARIQNCIFTGNFASLEGGGIYLENAEKPSLEGCLLAGNATGGRGSAISIVNSAPVFVNLTISGNLSTDAGAAVHSEVAVGNPQFRNTVIWGNENLRREIVSISFTSGSNLASYVGCLLEGVDLPQASGLLGRDLANDPLFEAPLAPSSAPIIGGDYRLQLGTPLMDQGTEADVTATTDLSGRPRIRRYPDIGAYEANLIFYVKETASGDGSGRNWANAADQLSELMCGDITFLTTENVSRLVLFGDGDEIRVAAGTFTPIGGCTLEAPPLHVDGRRYDSFALRSGTRILGGFNGLVESLTDRDLTQNETILSGEILLSNTTDDNSISVVETDHRESSDFVECLLDGFVIQDGNARIPFAGTPNSFAGRGGGLFINEGHKVKVQNCLFRDNNGHDGSGAVYLDFESSALFENCQFENNSTQGVGGAMGSVFLAELLEVHDCRFEGNSAEMGGGAVGLNHFSNFGSGFVTFTNSVFRGNTATSGVAVMQLTDYGASLVGCEIVGNEGPGTIQMEEESVDLVNCTIAANASQADTILLNGFGALSITNTLIWGNETNRADNRPFPATALGSTVTVSHSLLTSLDPAGPGNLDGTNLANDPAFQSPQAASSAPSLLGDYALVATSPVRNVGLGSANSQLTDFLGNPRMQGVIDLGALEYTPFATIGGITDDDDLDGVPNGVEIALGTSPTSADLADPRHLCFEDGQFSFGVDLIEQSDFILRLVRSEDLLSFPVVIATNENTDFTVDAEGLLHLSDPSPAASGRAFYRLEVVAR
ncbi:right-handed parallel beta-helix repeat-containing protein [Roseibacillus persicicus]|uniref:right-handed parallel beta-helix repeat-containing protein n=1 Tax=Roseibacillus persicicus TaxID=454148 RepID=UPI00398B0257